MTGHTKEPWGYDLNKHAIGIFSGDDLIAEINAEDAPALADAARIVDCVNALAGIDNPAALGALIEAAEAIAARKWDSMTEGCDTAAFAQSQLRAALAALRGGAQ